MNIAIVGAGISGISAAYNLQVDHQVTLYEREPVIGGHARTIVARDGDGGNWALDIGFIVHNDINYPLFSRFLKTLGVSVQSSDMSFSFDDLSSGVGYSGTLRGLFPTWSSLIKPAHVNTLFGIHKYSRKLNKVPIKTIKPDLSIVDSLKDLGCPQKLIYDYFLPIASAIWSCDLEDAERISARGYKEFFSNHGLLSFWNRPKWQTIRGGSREYIRAFEQTFRDRLLTGTTVTAVEEDEHKAHLTLSIGETATYDRVILATHADVSLKLLRYVSESKHRLLASQQYSQNTVYLHTDSNYMPQRKNLWASWNVIRKHGKDGKLVSFTTYNLNRLQNIGSRTNFFVTLNPDTYPPESNTIYQTRFRHPVLGNKEVGPEKLMEELNTGSLIKFCGAYTGYGFHEDGFKSGQIAARYLL